MFRKMLSDGNIRYFKYAPPTTSLDDISDDRLPEPPYAGVPREQRSVYYYWWAFLRENDEYLQCCANRGKGPMAELYRDFGDVRGEDFFEWWINTGRELFCERDGLAVKIHDHLPQQHDFEKELLVSIPLSAHTGRAMEELERTLHRILKKQRERNKSSSAPAKSSSTARYPVHTNPIIRSLHETLVVWHAYKQNERQKSPVPHYELADVLGLQVSKDHPENDPDTRQLKTSTVSRILKEARNLIYNVGQGRFPDKIGPSAKLLAARARAKAAEERRNNRSLGQPAAAAKRGRYK